MSLWAAALCEEKKERLQLSGEHFEHGCHVAGWHVPDRLTVCHFYFLCRWASPGAEGWHGSVPVIHLRIAARRDRVVVWGERGSPRVRGQTLPAFPGHIPGIPLRARGWGAKTQPPAASLATPWLLMRTIALTEITSVIKTCQRDTAGLGLHYVLCKCATEARVWTYLYLFPLVASPMQRSESSDKGTMPQALHGLLRREKKWEVRAFFLVTLVPDKRLSPRREKQESDEWSALCKTRTKLHKKKPCGNISDTLYANNQRAWKELGNFEIAPFF